jgi:hypothetical protein
MTRLTVAFATTRHAQAAVAFVRGAAFEVRVSVPAGGSGFDFALVEFEVRRADVGRLRTLLAGVHGIELAPSKVTAGAVA